MQENCEGITLRSVKYGDSSVIIKILTREYGLQSFITGTSRKRNTGVHRALLQPLQHLEITYRRPGKGTLKRLSEARSASHWHELHFHPVKSGICLFMAEVYSHLFEEGEEVRSFFDYQREALQWLETAQQGYGSWHLQVLFHNMTLLGLAPVVEPQALTYFDLQEGLFAAEQPLHPYWISGHTLRDWLHLANHLDWHAPPALTQEQRRVLLQAVLTYYRLHLRDFGTLRSLEVLQEVLR